MKAAIMVLFDDPTAQTTKHKAWIMDGFLNRNIKAQTYTLDLDHPEVVKYHLGRMVDFSYGRVSNNGHEPEAHGPEELSPEDVSFFKQLRKTLGPVLKEGGKRVWMGEEKYLAMKKAELEGKGKSDKVQESG